MGKTATEPQAGGTDTTADRPRGGIDVFDHVIVRQPLRPGRTDTLRDRLASWVGNVADGDARSLLPVDGVHLVTLFLDCGGFAAGTDGDALVWYIEVRDRGVDPWTDPVATVRGSPLFDADAGIGELLGAAATVHTAGHGGSRFVTHATNPKRRERYASAVGRPLVAPVAGEDLPTPVALVSMPLRSRPRAAVVARGLDLVNRLKRSAWLRERYRDATDVLEEERMYTESLLFDPTGDRPVLHYYMETEDMDRLYEAYEASNSWTVRLSDWMFRRFLERPEAFLAPPLESDCEVLVHAVDPDRP